MIKTEIIKPFKPKRKSLIFLMTFGCVFLLGGISIFILSILKIINIEGSGWKGNIVVYSSQGLLFIFLGYSQFKRNKYYIKLGNDRIKYFLPKHKEAVTIEYKEIIDITFNILTITVITEKSIFTINIEDMDYATIRKIKEQFETITN